MTETPEADIRRIYERWHATVLARDIDGLMALYAEDAILESPLVLAESGIDASGILTGKPAIRRFFDGALRKPGSALGRWYRTGTFFSDGRQITWEYPRATPEGDQVDLVEVMDLAAGLIAHHRVYWGWVGFRALTPSLNASAR
ncbi:nuclear transport factor 2 family protein [Methylobacterium pseudosasicola]|uniref:SnoaL-like domain-containing protein n=1 Tax=Methylobacterium pseudosasicola TaxID=582667 RepID=A0A1I4S2A3_9HYPH|nr:nuclear transport factor 2 family protein [Methylobacterium pseudosasicola]SFM58638.1 SnoaL-like domain-containing protein [Methylobacterium pseudosasicola]